MNFPCWTPDEFDAWEETGNPIKRELKDVVEWKLHSSFSHIEETGNPIKRELKEPLQGREITVTILRRNRQSHKEGIERCFCWVSRASSTSSTAGRNRQSHKEGIERTVRADTTVQHPKGRNRQSHKEGIESSFNSELK